uniref:Putative nonribosomal peptide synthetase n=1 Tax=Omphalotus olearius TaxID=72120 RepID=Q2VJ20_OMPOL|nr:putative nonribosomal peptide synthetase [Omphalotus olearius]
MRQMRTDEPHTPFSSVAGPQNDPSNWRSAASQCSVDPDDLEDVYFASSMQKSVLHVAVKSKPPGRFYIDLFHFHLPPHTDLGLLRKAWESTVVLYPSLRTAFCRSEEEKPAKDIFDETFALVYKPSRGSQGVWHECVREDLDQAAMQAIGFDFVRDLAFQPFSGKVPLAIHVVGNSAAGYHLRWCMHHAIYDGSSFKVFLRSFHQFYNARLRMCEIVPQPSFAPIAKFMNERTLEAREAAQKYWRRCLQNLPEVAWPPATVPTDSHPFLSETLYRTCPLPTYDVLDDPNRPAFRPKVVRAALALAMALHSGLEDHLFCETRSYRASLPTHLQSVSGPALFSALVRVSCGPGTRMDELLKAAGEDKEARTVMQNAPLVLGEILEAVGWEVASKVRVYLTIQARPFYPDQDDVPGWQLLDRWAYYDTPIYVDVLPPSNGTARVRFRYDAAVLQSVDMSAFADHFTTILTLLSRPEAEKFITALDVFRVLGIADRQHTLEYGQGPLFSALSTPAAPLAHELFESCAQRNPTAIALQFEDSLTMTYAELAARSNELAYELQGKGIGPEVMVPILFDNSLEMIVAILAIMKAGGAYVPLGVDHPKARLQRVVEITGAKLLVCGAALCAKARARDLKIAFPDIEVLDYARDPSLSSTDCARALPERRVSPEQLAYVLFTSGSTGVPKGVAVEHRNLCAFLHSGQGNAKGSPKMRKLLMSPYTFDVSIADIFSTLTSGGTLGLVRRLELLSNLPYWLGVMKTTHLAVTPSVGRQIPTEGLPHLRHILFAGETLPVDLAVRLSQTREVSNIMGPTETTIEATEYLVPKKLFGERVPIGYALGTTLIYIVRPTTLDLVARGEVGEICIGGPQVARGYVSDPELSSKKFVPDPFSRVEGAKIFRTGDLGRWNEFGQLDHLGRLDGQIKLRGLRIETGEIELVVQKADADIRGVYVDVLDYDGEQNLVAAFTLSSNSLGTSHSEVAVVSLTEPAVVQKLKLARAACTANLPAYMRPFFWLCLTHFPTDTSGKLDRRQVRALLHEHGATGLSKPVVDEKVAFRPPSNEAEYVMASVLSQLLNRRVESIDLDESFLSLGGNSLQAMRLTTALQAKGIGARLSDCLDDRKTVATIAISPAIERRNGGYEMERKPYKRFALAYPGWEDSVLAAGIEVEDVEDVYPLEATGREWLDFGFDTEGFGMICRFTYDLGSGIDPEHFAWSWERLRLIEPAQRTVFVQVPIPDKVFNRPNTSISVVLKPDVPNRGAGLDIVSAANETEAQELIKDLYARHHIEVGIVPIQSWLVHSKQEDKWFFATSRHHALHDGRTLGLLGKELSDLYVRGEAAIPDIQSKRTTENSYGAFMYATSDPRYLEDERTFWHGYLKGIGPTIWPSPSIVPVDFCTEASTLGLHIGQWEGSLYEVARKARVTKGAILRGALGAAVAEKEGRGETVVYEIVDGTSGMDISPWGFCVHVKPTKINAFPEVESSEADRFLDIVQYANRSHAETLSHQSSGLEVAFEVLGSQVKPGFKFQTSVFNIHDLDDGEYLKDIQQDGEATKEGGEARKNLFNNNMIYSSWARVGIPIYFELRVTKEKVIWVCPYDPKLFKKEEVEAVIQRQIDLLQALSDAGQVN